MSMEFRNTKKAMEKLKDDYFLLKVDGKIRGLILKSQEGLLKINPKDYLCSPRSYSTVYCRNIGYSLKDPATKKSPVEKDFKQIECNDFAVGKHGEADGRYVEPEKNQCLVLMTAEEGKNDATFTNTIMISEVFANATTYRLDAEETIADDLKKAGVEVIDYDEYLNKSDKPEPSNDQDVNKQLSNTARPGRPLAEKNEIASFSKTQRPRHKSAKSFMPKIRPADNE